MTYLSWSIPKIPNINKIITGDMPGDKINIEEEHITKANTLFQEVMRWLALMPEEDGASKYVISIYGGSGVGKSEIASVLAFYLNFYNIGTYILSGDNYVRERPCINDLRREEILSKEGIEGLKRYLGSKDEIDFNSLNEVIDMFKSGESLIHLYRLTRDYLQSWKELVHFSKNYILIVEWTHGNNSNLRGIDFPIYLHSSPQETLEHRKKRKRDSNTDSNLISQVLEIEQELLVTQASRARVILSKKGEVLINI